jgi:hypothetical protein
MQTDLSEPSYVAMGSRPDAGKKGEGSIVDLRLVVASGGGSDRDVTCRSLELARELVFLSRTPCGNIGLEALKVADDVGVVNICLSAYSRARDGLMYRQKFKVLAADWS